MLADYLVFANARCRDSKPIGNPSHKPPVLGPSYQRIVTGFHRFHVIIGATRYDTDLICPQMACANSWVRRNRPSLA